MAGLFREKLHITLAQERAGLEFYRIKDYY
jgi:hypothetical protein